MDVYTPKLSEDIREVIGGVKSLRQTRDSACLWCYIQLRSGWKSCDFQLQL